jgi:hypothetical protein
MMGKRFCQFDNFRMRLSIVPADALLLLEDSIVILQKLSVRKIEILKYTEFQTIAKPDTSSDETSQGAIRIKVKR